MKYLQNEQVLILGLGISGLAMARWCVRCGALVRVADTRETPSGLRSLKQQVPDLDFIAGEFTLDLLAGGVTQILRSPGLMPDDKGLQAVMAKAKELGIPVRGELDLFAEALLQIDIEKIQIEEAIRAQAQQERAQDDESTTIVMQLPEDEVALEKGDVDLDEFEADDLMAEPVIEPLPVVTGYKPKVIAITGTNGKTTVTSLTAVLVTRAGKTVIAAGNIGLAMMDALSECLDAGQLPEVWVLELSSFQLENTKKFEPTAATILNVTQDHLDWHGTMENYVVAKGNIFGAHTTRVLNRDDVISMRFVPKPVEEVATKRKRLAKNAFLPLVTFGTDAPNQAGDFGIIESGGTSWLVQTLEADETTGSTGLAMNLLMPVEALHIRGRHNASNALAALALASMAGCEIGSMLRGLRDYRGEPHRVELIGTVAGVGYIDDSKGTNVGATAAAIAGLGADLRDGNQIVLILGGQGKGQDFSPLVPLVADYVKSIALIGQDAKVIETALKKTDVPMMHAATLSEAVELSASQASSGDIVLLSPACASLDMFKDYKHRAQVFVEAVQGLQEQIKDEIMRGEQ